MLAQGMPTRGLALAASSSLCSTGSPSHERQEPDRARCDWWDSFEVCAYPHGTKPLLVAVHRVSSLNHDRYLWVESPALRLSDQADNLHAIELGHLDTQDDTIDVGVLSRQEGLEPIARRDNRVPCVPQQAGERFTIQGIVYVSTLLPIHYPPGGSVEGSCEMNRRQCLSTTATCSGFRLRVERGEARR